MTDTEPRNIELRIGYRGTRYFGWQIQPHQPTVQGLIQATLRRVTGEAELRTTGASRTDTGVHAHDNRVGFLTRSAIPCDGLVRTLNHILPDDIRVFEAAERAVDFSVRRHARAKHYSYLFYNGDDPSPFTAGYFWRYRQPLNADIMATCARMFEGTRCFKALQAAADFREETESTIFATSVTRHGKVICFDVIGRHFLYHMVRNMAGSLMMVGKGEWTADVFRERLETGDRRLMGATAPAQGLHLFRVFYQEAPYAFAEERTRFLHHVAHVST